MAKTTCFDKLTPTRTAHLEGAYDRLEPGHCISGGEPMSTTALFNYAWLPEPSEWISIIIGAVLAGLLTRIWLGDQPLEGTY